MRSHTWVRDRCLDLQDPDDHRGRRPLPPQDAPRGRRGPPGATAGSLEEVLADPQIARYVEDWGRSGDTGRIAESPEGAPLGAAWYRRFSAAQPGHGFVSEAVPEVSIAVGEQARGAGVGTALLTALIDEARRQDHPALSLSVLGENPAVRLYERLGFCLVEVVGEYQTMRLDL